MISNENLRICMHLRFHLLEEVHVLIKFDVKHVFNHCFRHKIALHVFLDFHACQIFTMICYTIAESSLSMDFPLGLDLTCGPVPSNLLLEAELPEPIISIGSLQASPSFL